MSLKSWWADRRQRRQAKIASREIIKAAPLREFVYLDEVSLHSLLVSQKSTLLETVSEESARAEEAEVAGVAGANAVGVKSEVSARYQTSNSNSMQSSRKAVVQSLFKELRDLPLTFRLAHRVGAPAPLTTSQAVVSELDPAVVLSVDELTRGTLVEIEVELAVDPVFKLGSMMTEWKAMADDYPAMFGAPGLLGFLRESEPIMKVLDRFLAGLVPIKAEAVHYKSVMIDGAEYIVDKRAVEALELESYPLYVVGVTEKLGYWKDLRRVLFSNARFTVFGRVARDSLHDSWTPVKLADLFADVAPGFVDQINAIEAPKVGQDSTSVAPIHVAHRDALRAYAVALAERCELTIDADSQAEIDVLIGALAAGPATPTAQRQAFDKVLTAVTALSADSAVAPDADADIALRRNAREVGRLDLFPSPLSLTTPPAPTLAGNAKKPRERMLDVEVVGIYW